MNRPRWAPILLVGGAIVITLAGAPTALAAQPDSSPRNVVRLDPDAVRPLGVVVPDRPAGAPAAPGAEYWVATGAGWAGLRHDPRVTSVWDTPVFHGVVMTLPDGQVDKVRERQGVTSVRRVGRDLVTIDSAVKVIGASAGDASVALLWNRVPSRATRVQQAEAGTQEWQPATGCTEIAAPTTSCVVSDLTNGKPYVFRVRALTAGGPGPWSAASPPVTPRVSIGPPPSPTPTVTPTPTPTPTTTPTPKPSTSPTPKPTPTARPKTRAYAWGRDRLDHPYLPLDRRYRPSAEGDGVHVVIVDTGIQADAGDFTGRVGHGYSPYARSPRWDCNGHGTHVAGTAAGAPAVGVARRAKIHPVAVTSGCEPYIDERAEILAMLWVLEEGPRPAVVNYSAGSYSPSSPLEVEVFGMLAEAGIPVVVASGNEYVSSCRTSPSDIPSTISVGATNKRDLVPWWNTYGRCIDVYAPGVHILSTSYRYHRRGRVSSGTSMAAPHVTGALAVRWSLHPKLSAQGLVTAFLAADVPVVRFPSGGHGAPNLLAQVPSEFAPTPTPTKSPVPTPTPVPTTPVPTTPVPDPIDTPVTPSPEPIPENTNEPLAVTGSDPVPGLLAGALLVAFGAAAMVLGTRRSSHRSLILSKGQHVQR